MGKFACILFLVLLVGCASGNSNIDPSISDDLINISKALSEGKSISEALGTVKKANVRKFEKALGVMEAILEDTTGWLEENN